MSQYKVISALKTGEYDGKFGKMFKYAVGLEGLSDAVELSQKPETAAPKAGDTLNGSIEETQYGKRFKKELSGGNGNGGKFDTEGMAWGNALTNATTIVCTFLPMAGSATSKYPSDAMMETLKVAKFLFDNRGGSQGRGELGAIPPQAIKAAESPQPATFDPNDQPPVDQLTEPF